MTPINSRGCHSFMCDLLSNFDLVCLKHMQQSVAHRRVPLFMHWQRCCKPIHSECEVPYLFDHVLPAVERYFKKRRNSNVTARCRFECSRQTCRPTECSHFLALFDRITIAAKSRSFSVSMIFLCTSATAPQNGSLWQS